MTAVFLLLLPVIIVCSADNKYTANHDKKKTTKLLKQKTFMQKARPYTPVWTDNDDDDDDDGQKKERLL